MVKYLSALFFPFVLVLLFTRVTYHPVTGLILTVALIAASVYKGYTNSLGLIVVDAFSLTLGFWYAKKMMARTRKSA
ncbi:CsbA family protein [Bacillus methanolicus]|uniref:Putative membrane protein n=1 Tax=Bacillus methanolicus (strain MGA3 / ATCC 53907) TaxID=796606 RepID=I3DU69_BACMM|nr:CsbA family protein [Bacillus methanolicus]AIE61323.1 putative membrane protein [Bacillus methanolicus MGA3]EIJ77790.1 CsbA protein [Bacillus methanolicus MGA3]UQD53365.1 DUF2198 family protein [Bacillus methanolicus]